MPATTTGDRIALPRATALALWAASFLRGESAPDDALAAAHGTGDRHEEHLGEDLFDWLVSLRNLPLGSVRPVLPLPGRIAGLIGPPPAVVAALEAEQALIVTAGGIGVSTLVPAVQEIGSDGAVGIVVRWESFAAPQGAPMPPSPTAGGRERLLGALRAAARSTERLDLVPDAPVPLTHLPSAWTAVDMPPGAPAPQAQLLHVAAHTMLLAAQEIEHLDPILTARTGTPALSAQTSREALLRELHDAAREAVVDIVGSLTLT